MAPFDLAQGSNENFADRSSTPGGGFAPPSASTLATIHADVGVYSAGLVFVVILLLITLILLDCGVIVVVLKYTTTAPDVLGYVSSMTRDNPFIVVPEGGTALE